MPLLYSFEYEISEELSARMADSFVRQRRKQAPLDAKFWKAISFLLLCTLVSAALVAISYLAEISIAILFIPAVFLGLFGGVLFLVMISIVTARVIEGISVWLIRRRLIASIPHSYDRKVRWTFTNEGFHVHTADKDRQVPWHAIRRFLSDSDFWFLGVQDGPDLILPVENLGTDVKELIRAKAANLLATTTQTSDQSVDRGNAVVFPERSQRSLKPEQVGEQMGLPFTEPSISPAILDDGNRQQLKRKTPFGRFMYVIFSIGVTIFLLQKNHLAETNPPIGKLVAIGALAIGASFAAALMVKRALEPAKVTPEKAKSVRL